MPFFWVSGKRMSTTNDFRVVEIKTLDDSKIKFCGREILLTNKNFV